MQLSEFISKKKVSLLLAITIFAAGLLAGLLIEHYRESMDKRQLNASFEVRQGGYKLTNPLLECEIAKDTIGDREIRPFKDKVQELIASETRNKKADFLAVYFRDLNNGPWFGINEKELFTPASLMKVPIMMAYFKLAESSPKLLSKKITYQGGEDKNDLQYFKPPTPLIRGHAYTVDELIYRMVAYSDNNAKDLLVANLNPVLLTKVFADMGVKIPRGQTQRSFLPVKTYASFFRVLFNASYLSRDFSEKALQYLSESTFTKGLISGVPESVRIAHKFGEFTDAGLGVKQLHDCGIVYFPNSPYLLCIMTIGNDLDTLAETIKDVSALVYKELSIQEENQKGVLPFVTEGSQPAGQQGDQKK